MTTTELKPCKNGCGAMHSTPYEFDWSGCAEEWEASHPDRQTFKVCRRCRGRGTHTNPAIDGHGITQSEMDELGDEFREDYFAGVYDVACEVCGGKRVVTAAMRQKADEEREYAAEVDAERRMGA